MLFQTFIRPDEKNIEAEIGPAPRMHAGEHLALHMEGTEVFFEVQRVLIEKRGAGWRQVLAVKTL